MPDLDFEIELQDGQKELDSSIQLPLNFLTFGEIENDDVKVYIKQDVYKALEKYATSDTSKELGTILIGNYCENMGKTHVVISDFIEAKYTDASASTLTFTHETWDYVYKQQALLYSNKKIIGWQHTHPNYGIFLSNYDLFIQENFFNLPFQIAYVIDPIQNIRGFFQWKNGKIEKLNGYYVYDEIGKPIKIEQIKVKKDGAKGAPKPSKLLTAIVSVFCVATLSLSIFAVSLNNKYKNQLVEQKTVLTEIDNQKAVIDDQSKAIKDLQDKLEGRLEGKLEDDLDNNKDTGIKFKSYIVVEGDSLSKICKNHNIDYDSNKRIILSVNGIENENQIYIGQTILLPIEEQD